MTKPSTSTPVSLMLAVLVVVALFAAACGGDDPEFADDGADDDGSAVDEGADGANGDDGSAGGDDASTDGGDGTDGAAGPDGDGTDDGSADGDEAGGDGETTPTPAAESSLPDPLPAPDLTVGQPTAEDAVFLYVAAQLGVSYVGDCRNLDPADYESGIYCSVTDGTTYTLGQAPDLVEATLVVVEGGDGWVIDSATSS